MEKYYRYIKKQMREKLFHQLFENKQYVDYQVSKDRIIRFSFLKGHNKIMAIYKENDKLLSSTILGTWNKTEDNIIKEIDIYINIIEKDHTIKTSSPEPINSGKFDFSIYPLDGLLIGEPINIPFDMCMRTSAIDTYDDGVKKLRFSSDKRKYFMPRRRLYSKYCTKEGYAVWAAAHNQRVDELEEVVGNWYNLVFSDIIYEMWRDSTGIEFCEDKRVTYLRCEEGYFLVGLYEYNGNHYKYNYKGEILTVKEYSFVSKYPEENK